MPLQWQAIEYTKRGLMPPLRIWVMVNFMNPSKLVELVWFEKILNTSPTSFAQLCRWVKARWNEPKKKRVKNTIS
jgi:hypothetical protein